MEVPAGSLVLGFPAKVARLVDASMRQRIEEAWRHYVEKAQQHRSGKYSITK
jgi:carbonic anhydrase/acetyltransferase-like protein (isoleucine patch superfamily)